MKVFVVALLSFIIPSLAFGYEFMVTYTTIHKEKGIILGNIQITSKTKNLSDDDIVTIRKIIQKNNSLKEDENVVITNIYPLAVKKK